MYMCFISKQSLVTSSYFLSLASPIFIQVGIKLTHQKYNFTDMFVCRCQDLIESKN